jgi:LPPG:FO 2-phospho-L-lactate transferase
VDGVDLQDWFTLGDRDLATNLLRTRLLEAGATISGATDALRRAMGIGCRVIPVTDDPVRTVFRTSGGETLDFQTYFVRRRQEPAVVGIAFDGIGGARPAPGVLDAIAAADVVVVPPSNPLISVEPVLAVPGVREALSQADGARLGVSPIVGGKALKGPADLLMAALGHDVSAAGVAAIYRGLLDVFVLDERDADLADRVAELGMRPVVADTIMRSPEDAARVAKAVLDGAA